MSLRTLLGLVVLLAAVPGCGPSEPPRHLLLFVIDTLRADRLGAYGNEAAATQNLDTFAGEAVLFENAYAPAFYTATSHASLFTSTYPATHGVWNEKLHPGWSELPVLSPNHITLAETLGMAGFETAAIADGGWVSRARGLLQGFGTVDSSTRGTHDRVGTALDWLEQRDPERRFFLFLHTYEVHAPYVPPAGGEDAFAGSYDGPLRGAVAKARAWQAAKRPHHPLKDLHRKFFLPLLEDPTPEDTDFLFALYDAELHVVDNAFARLRAELERRGLWDDTLVIVTADHGEEFYEHGKGGHHQLNRATLHIPLIIRDPRGPAGLRRADLVDLVDVMPTALALLGVRAPERLVGRELSLRGSSGSEARMLVGEEDSGLQPLLTVRDESFRAIFRGDEVEVFDVREDPQELHDIADSERVGDFITRARAATRTHREEGQSLRTRLKLGPHAIHREDLAAPRREQLRALGYIE